MVYTADDEDATPVRRVSIINDYVVVEVAGFEVPLDNDTARRVREAMYAGDWDEVGRILAGMTKDGEIPDHETLRRKATIAAQMTKLKREMDELDLIPKEPRPEDSPNGTAVLTFHKTFGTRTGYTYAAIRVGNQWVITGNNNRDRKFTWLDLWKFIGQSEPTRPTVWFANGFTEV